MANIDNNTNTNNETFWYNGQPMNGIKTTVLPDTGSEKYWYDGQPAGEFYTKGNYETGKFFLLFDE